MLELTVWQKDTQACSGILSVFSQMLPALPSFLLYCCFSLCAVLRHFHSTDLNTQIKLWRGPKIIFSSLQMYTSSHPHTFAEPEFRRMARESTGCNPCHSNSVLSNTASPSSSTLALSGWDSVRLCRADLFHFVAPHAQHRGGVKGAG